jgi:hypothetical protein
MTYPLFLQRCYAYDEFMYDACTTQAHRPWLPSARQREP